MTLVVDSLGWRNGYYVQALFVLVIVAPITLLMRRTPEDTGLRPDGETGRGKRGDALTDAAEQLSYTSSQAVCTPDFWLLLFGLV